MVENDPTMAAFHEQNFEHVMIDIETMSLSRHRALILSVGMVEFDPTPTKRVVLGERRLITPSITAQLAMGRHVSEGTQKFWRDQPVEARDHWAYPKVVTPLLVMLSEIRDFCHLRTRVWANGTQFDLSNLEGLAEDCEYGEDLWHYQCPRDMRTFVKENPQTRVAQLGDVLDEKIIPHEPVSDCISQAFGVWSHWRTDG